MLSFFGRIFGTGKALEQGMETVDKATTGIISGVDALFYTDEEKSAAAQKAMETRIEMVKSLQDEFTPRSITRRILAVIIVGSTFLHFNVLIALGVLGAMFPRMVNGINAQGQEILYNSWDKAFEVTGQVMIEEVKITMIVCFFYFGYYGVKSIVKSTNKK